jgi:branched-chain amino acid transport system ATP-binding protein
MAEVLLSVQGLMVAYGGIRAVKGVDLEVRAGEKVCLIGSNGAGKTTVLKAITGLLPLQAGQVILMGQNTVGLGAWDRVQRGLVMVPEGRGVFSRMSVLENLQMGAYVRRDDRVASDLERVWSLLPRLAERRKHLAGNLSGGEQQMLAMGRALMSQPRLLLLDEPSMGLSPVMVDKIFQVIDQLSRDGVTLLLVEQNASRALQMADRAYVMESGLIRTSGAAAQLLHDPQVREAYLGQ